MHSIIELTGNGTNRRFPITFTLGLLRREYVRCRVGTESDASGNPLYRALTWDDNDPGYVTVQGTAPGSGVPVVFTREVPVDVLLYDFQKGAHLGSMALNESHEQLMMAVHQMIDAFQIAVADMESDVDTLVQNFNTITNQIRTDFNTITNQIKADFNVLVQTVDDRFATELARIQYELTQAIIDAKAIAEYESGAAVESRFTALSVAVQIIPNSQDMGASYNPTTNVLTLYLHEIGLPDGLMDSINSKVSKTGDTMTGNLYVGASGTNRALINTEGTVLGSTLRAEKAVLSDTSHYVDIEFRAVRPDGTANNRRAQIRSISEKSAVAVGTIDDPALLIDAKGMLFAGSGESATSMRSVLVTGVTAVPAGLQRVWKYAGVYNDATEHTVISSDNYLYLITNCNTIANAKGAYLGPDGGFFPHLAVGQSLGSSSARWDAYIRDLNVSGPVALSSSLAVSGSTSISGDLNVSGTITGRSAPGSFVGDIRFLPLRAWWMPPGWYYCNGGGYSLTSAQGIVLNSFIAQFKSDWKITVSGSTIYLPNFFYTDGRGYFVRANNDYVGPGAEVQGDAIRNITGYAYGDRWHSGSSRSGAFYNGGRSSGAYGTGSTYSGESLDFDASRVVPVAGENRPLNVGMTPAIYLGV